MSSSGSWGKLLVVSEPPDSTGEGDGWEGWYLTSSKDGGVRGWGKDPHILGYRGYYVLARKRKKKNRIYNFGIQTAFTGGLIFSYYTQVLSCIYTLKKKKNQE